MSFCCFLSFLKSLWPFAALAGFCLLVSFFKPRTKTVSFRGKHVIITGGSSGIGLSLAKSVLKKYGTGESGKDTVVTLIARNKQKLEKAKDELLQCTSCCENQIQIYSCDVTSYNGMCETVVAACQQCQQPVSVLICSAGITSPQLIQHTSEETFRSIMHVNVLGSFNAAKAVVPFMTGVTSSTMSEESGAMSEKRGDEEHNTQSQLQMETVALQLRDKCGIKTGSDHNQNSSICLLSSQAGCIGLIGYTAYSSSKFALRGLAEALQMELRPYSVSVTLSHPPDTETPSLQKENQERSQLLKDIAETSSVWSSDSVADKIISDISNNVFLSHFGIIGFLLSIGTASCSPVHSIARFIIEIFLAGVARFAVLFFHSDFDSKVSKALKIQKERQSLKTD